MNQLTKVASVCARKVLEKKATSGRQLLDALDEGAKATAKHDALLKAVHGQGSTIPTWLKAALGIGGAKVVLDNTGQRSSTGWRR